MFTFAKFLLFYMRKGLVVAAVCLLVSCKDSKMQNVYASEDEVEEDSVEAYVGDTLHLFDEEVEPPVTVDELFADFFFSFADDPRFQSQRITFPLSCKEGEEDTRLTRQDWTEYNHFNAQDIYSIIYEREQDLALQKDTSIMSVGVEWCYLKENLVEKYLFNRINGKWMLTEILKEEIDFLRFYSNFVADSTFQRDAIGPSLKLVLTSEDGEEETTEEILSADDWFNLRNDLPLSTDVLTNIDYGQTCISQNRKTLLMEGVSNGMQMKFKFDKQGEDWKLIEIEY